MQNEAQRERKRRGRWFRFSLRTLMLVVACVAVLCAVVKKRCDDAWAQQDAVRRIREYDGGCVYDFQIDSSGEQIHSKLRKQPGPKWLRDLIGVDFLARVKRVSFWETYLNHDIQGADYALYEQLPHLEEIEFFDTRFRGEGVLYLARLPHLRRVILGQVELTDADIRGLTALKQIKILWITQCRHDEASLLHLGTMSNLEQLHLSTIHTEFGSFYPSDDTVQQLKQALPNCDVQVMR